MKLRTLSLLVAFAGILTFTFAQNQTTNDPAKAKALIKLCADWDDAYIKKDPAAVEQLLTADYIGIDDEGATTTKAEEIELIKTGAYVIHSVEHLEPPKVRIHGSSAIVTSHSKVRLTYKDDTTTTIGRATTVCVDTGNGRWQIASWHASKVKGE
jgi:ketosteroid isomerase-like protein